MTTIIIIAVFVLFAGLLIYLDKTKVVEDKNGNFIPDVIEDKLDEVKQKVSKKIKETKTRVKPIKSEIQDVVSTVKGKLTKSKLNSFTKEQLVSVAKSDHDIDLDISVQKSTLVNKVYSLYNKPQK